MSNVLQLPSRKTLPEVTGGPLRAPARRATHAQGGSKCSTESEAKTTQGHRLAKREQNHALDSWLDSPRGVDLVSRPLDFATLPQAPALPRRRLRAHTLWPSDVSLWPRGPAGDPGRQTGARCVRRAALLRRVSLPASPSSLGRAPTGRTPQSGRVPQLTPS